MQCSLLQLLCQVEGQASQCTARSRTRLLSGWMNEEHSTLFGPTMAEQGPPQNAVCPAPVVFQQEPFADAIRTPVMQRAHGADFAGSICFVDSTASCDANILPDFNCSWRCAIRCGHRWQHFNCIVHSRVYLTKVDRSWSVFRRWHKINAEFWQLKWNERK